MYKYCLFFIVLFSCSQPANVTGNRFAGISDAEIQEHYPQLLSDIHQRMRNIKKEDIPAFAETCLKDSIFSCWYETPWDFNGTTEIPRKGQIACGYFVTTTLQHLGLDIDRVYLAQQASSAIIKNICDPASIKVFTNLSYKKMKAYVKTYEGNIFIAGLDNHVGFIVKENNEMYFVHSSGIPPHKVIKEKCDEANLLVYSKYHMVGHLNFSRWAQCLQQQQNP